MECGGTHCLLVVMVLFETVCLEAVEGCVDVWVCRGVLGFSGSWRWRLAVVHAITFTCHITKGVIAYFE